MKVNEALANLQKLVDAGAGELELIYRDCRSGDTGGVSIYSGTERKDPTDDMGRLCDEEDGWEYVPVYTDH